MGLFFWSIATFIVIALSSVYGASGFLGFSDIFLDDTARAVYMTLRLPRIVLAFVIGSGLSLCGCALQSYFRNDLCCPYTLGVSGYASLGAVLGMYFHYSPAMISVCSALGACFALCVLSVLSLSMLREDTARLLLIGIALAFTSSSLVGLLQHLSDPEKLFVMSKWLQGGIEVVGLEALLLPSIAVFVLFFLLFGVRRELDLMIVSQEYALARGVQTKYVAILVLLSTSIFVGIITSISGPIAFVGLFMPHIVRRYVGSLHRDLLVHSFFLGGVFLVFIDLLSRVIIAPAELPIGILAGVIGAPVFIYLLIQSSYNRRIS